MVQRFYPAVLERGARQVFGVWFPDFPRCVAAAASQEQAMARAQGALAQAVDALVERERALPEPTPLERIAIPRDCDFVAFFVVGVEPPDPSERVNVYLPKSLIGRADRRAGELGMSRSSFFGYAVTCALDDIVAKSLGSARIALRAPGARTQVRRARKPRARKS